MFKHVIKANYTWLHDTKEWQTANVYFINEARVHYIILSTVINHWKKYENCLLNLSKRSIITMLKCSKSCI